MEEHIYSKAKKKVEAKKGFYWHLSIFFIVGIFFFLMNIFTMGDDPDIWFIFPLLPWSVGLAIHYLAVFGLPGSKILTKSWEEAELEKEIEKLQRESGQYEPGQLDLEDFQKQKRKEKSPNWRDQDLV